MKGVVYTGNISIYEITSLLMVIDEQSISNASKKLHVTQPAISKLVKRIEESFNIELFDRNKYPWQLTKVGILFKEYCTNVLKEHEKLLDKIDEIVLDRKGYLKFATMLFEERYVLTQVFVEFYKKYPNFKIDIFLESSKKTEQLLLDKKVDFANVVLPVKSKYIKSIPIKKLEILLCVPNDFLLDEKIKIPKKNAHPEIDLIVFKDKPFILHKEQYGLRTWQNYIFKKMGFMPNNDDTIEVAQHTTAVDLANKGIGICFVLDELLKHIQKSTSTSIFRIKDLRPTQTVALAYLKDRKLSDVEKDFVKIVQENVSD